MARDETCVKNAVRWEAGARWKLGQTADLAGIRILEKGSPGDAGNTPNVLLPRGRKYCR